MRRNGCQWPFHPQQVAAWVLLVVGPLEFYGLACPLLWVELRVVCLVLFSLLYVAVLCTLLAATLLDPSIPPRPETDNLKICSVCHISVDNSSKHCVTCDRCVIGFDHHCKWFNNCVGKRNYGLFCGCIGSLEAILLTAFAANACALGAVLQDSGESAEEYIGKRGGIVCAAVYGAVLLATAVGAWTNGELIFLHIWLLRHHLTTADYLRNKHINSSFPKQSTDPSTLPVRRCVLMKGKSLVKVQPAQDFNVLFSIPTGAEEYEAAGGETNISSGLSYESGVEPPNEKIRTSSEALEE